MGGCKEAVGFVDTLHGFVGAGDVNQKPTVYATADGGQTWSPTSLPDPPDFKSQPGFTLHVAWIKLFGSNLYLEASGQQQSEPLFRQYIFISTDGGTTWRWLTKLPSLSTAMVTESRWIYLYPPNNSGESINGGQQWHPFQCDYSQAAPIAPQIVFADSSVGYAIARGTIMRTQDGGHHWVAISTPGMQ